MQIKFSSLDGINGLKDGKSSNERYTKDEIKLLFEYVQNHLTKDSSLSCIKELALLATDESVLQGRNHNAYALIIERIFVILFGVLPYGESKSRAEQFLTPNTLFFEVHDEFFMDDLTAQQNLNAAIQTSPERIIESKIDKESALKLMYEEFKKIKNTLTKKNKEILTSSRNFLIEEIMKGIPASIVFNSVLSN